MLARTTRFLAVVALGCCAAGCMQMPIVNQVPPGTHLPAPDPASVAVVFGVHYKRQRHFKGIGDLGRIEPEIKARPHDPHDFVRTGEEQPVHLGATKVEVPLTVPLQARQVPAHDFGNFLLRCSTAGTVVQQQTALVRDPQFHAALVEGDNHYRLLTIQAGVMERAAGGATYSMRAPETDRDRSIEIA